MNAIESGAQCSLEDLFSGAHKIVIPDLQRDYCWGDPVHGDQRQELVSGFLHSLLEAHEAYAQLKDAQQKADYQLTLGVIYTYKSPAGDLVLCDGQQRLTTLFLLLGMLNRRLDGRLQHLLISPHELYLDDREPYLRYAVRESTLYFLSDLVCRYFIEGQGTLKPGDKEGRLPRYTLDAPWNFSEYDLDPTIQSMLRALAVMEPILKDKNDLDSFADFVVRQVKLFYFELAGRSHGEELFVLINTTGEPLTPTENLKPKLLGEQQNSDELNRQWEERETFFWKHRRPSEHEADGGLEDFLTWTLKAEKAQADVSLSRQYRHLDLPRVQLYFNRLQRLLLLLTGEEEGLRFRQQFSFILPFTVPVTFTGTLAYLREMGADEEALHIVLVPLLRYMVDISSEPEAVYSFLRRLRRNYFDFIRKERNDRYVNWRYAVQIIGVVSASLPPDPPLAVEQFRDLSLLTPVAHAGMNAWYSEEDAEVHRLKQDFRAEVESWEDHPHFMGDLSPLLKVHRQLCGTAPYQKPVLARFFSVYITLLQKTEQKEDGRLFNQCFLLGLRSGYVNGGFAAEYRRVTAIERLEEAFLHRKEWFYPLWIQLYEGGEDPASWTLILEKFNRRTFLLAVRHRELTDELLLEGDRLPPPVSREELEAFIGERTTNWSWWNGYIFALLYVLFYLEAIEAEGPMNLSAYEQIGVRPFYEKDVAGRYTLGNIKWGFHKYGSSFLHNNLKLYQRVKAVHGDEREGREEGCLAAANTLYEEAIRKVLAT